MKKRIVGGLVTGTIVFGAVTGLAASLSVGTDQLGSGSQDVSSCDSDGVHTAYNYNQNAGIASVVVSGIQDGGLVGAGACDGETVFVELLGSNGAVLTNAVGSVDVTADVDLLSDQVTVPMDAATPAAQVTGVRVTITG